MNGKKLMQGLITATTVSYTIFLYFNQNGDQAIHIAAMYDADGVLELLLKCGVTIEARGEVVFRTKHHYSRKLKVHRTVLSFSVYYWALL